MNRIPTDLDLTALNGLEVIQVAIGEHQVILQFHPIGAITLEGGWVLRKNGGEVIDRSIEHQDRDAWSIHKVLGSKIQKCVIRDDTHLDVIFESITLEIEDDSDSYETFSIDHPSVRLYV